MQSEDKEGDIKALKKHVTRKGTRSLEVGHRRLYELSGEPGARLELAFKRHRVPEGAVSYNAARHEMLTLT